MDTMNTLAIDIGGTKVTLAVFANEQMVARSTQPTDRAGSRDWMVQHIVTTARDWGDSGRWTAAASASAGRSISRRSAWCSRRMCLDGITSICPPPSAMRSGCR